VAVDDGYTTDEDTPLNVALPGVLTNDTDADGDGLTAVLNAGPANAQSFTLNADGSFDYTPTADFNGDDTFTYHANDGTADSNIATVTITVNAQNDAPVASDDGYATNEGVPLNVAPPGVLGNDTDPDGDGLTAVLDTGPANALSFTLNVDGSFDYVPNGGFSGSDNFTYHANDGTTDSNIATVTITVTELGNSAPVAVDDSYATNEDTQLSVTLPGVLGNDTDADGDGLTAVLNTDVSNGSLTLNADGSFDYTPDSDFNGSDSFRRWRTTTAM
jgi:VCBS repeat-containing protein